MAETRFVLVEDRPDDLLEQILHRHESRGAAVLVEDHGQMHLEPLHVRQDVLHFPRSGDEERRAHDRPDGIQWPGAQRRQDVLGQDHAHDLIERFGVDGIA
jgi:hypothetical protein